MQGCRYFLHHSGDIEMGKKCVAELQQTRYERVRLRDVCDFRIEIGVINISVSDEGPDVRIIF
jgi:hypothetical protein